VVNVMLVDHRTVVRQGLCALVEQQSDLVVVAQAATLRGAGTVAVTPDVIVTEIDLPDARHQHVISGLRRFFPPSPILVLTLVGHPARVQSVLEAGANGYLLKTAAAGDLLTGIRALAGGETYLQPSVRVEMTRWRQPRDKALELTPKEVQVLQLLARGHTNVEIAGLCGISIRTVETRRRRVHQKLGLWRRAELFQYAWDAGLLDLDLDLDLDST
jgi:DNA-binding NarL/FixJ family response regulator